MKKTKRITALLLAGLMSVSVLTACGKKEESGYIDSESSYEYTEEPTTEPRTVEIPVSSKDCLNKDESDILKMFQKAGFADVETEGLSDLLTKDKGKSGQVKEVTIDTKKSFKKGDKVMSDVVVKIIYHSENSHYMPFDSKELDGKNYEDIVTQLKDEGFTNIKTKAFEDNGKEKDSVKSVSVNGETEFDDYTSYIADAKIVVTYYTEKKESSKTESKQESKQESKSESSKSLIGDSGAVTPSFKEYMDSYEDFMNEYVDLMKNYNSDPMKYMTEYLEYMEKLGTYTDKLDSYDEDDMSAADWAYYLEVTTRVNKKLLEVQ